MLGLLGLLYDKNAILRSLIKMSVLSISSLLLFRLIFKKSELFLVSRNLAQFTKTKKVFKSFKLNHYVKLLSQKVAFEIWLRIEFISEPRNHFKLTNPANFECMHYLGQN